MCISTDESSRSNRRPVSRNNEHDYSTWKIDEYDMELAEYLIEGSLNNDDSSDLLDDKSKIDEKNPFQTLDETLNYDASCKKSGRKGLSCPICFKTWVTPSKLKRHMASHKEELKSESPPLSPDLTQCPICHHLVDSQKDLTKHMADYHLKVETEKEPLIATKIGSKYTCTICKAELNSPWKLQAHMKGLHMKKPPKRSIQKYQHPCPHCDKVCVTPSKLKRHLNTHTKIRKNICKETGLYKRPPERLRHECSVCGKGFVTPSKLMRHMPVHKDVKGSETALEISTVTSILGD
jgi:hypothetical protein